MRHGVAARWLFVGALCVIAAPSAFAQPIARFDPFSLPFSDPDPAITGRSINPLRLSGDGTTVYGVLRESRADTQQPFGFVSTLTAWRWRENTGYEVLDLSPAVASPDSMYFGTPTADGSVAPFYGNGQFGATGGFWTPQGVQSTSVFTQGALLGQPAAISADGTTTLVSGGSYFATWSEDRGEVSAAMPYPGWTNSAPCLSADGDRVVGYAFPPGQSSGAVWIHDAEDGFTTIEVNDSWIVPNAISADGSVITGQRLYSDREEAFIWDAVNGLRSLTPGSIYGVTSGVYADANIVDYSVIPSDTFIPENRLLLNGVLDVGVYEGLEVLGYEIDELHAFGFPHATFSEDGYTALVRDGANSYALLRSSVPAPGGAALALSLAPLLGRRRRSAARREP